MDRRAGEPADGGRGGQADPPRGAPPRAGRRPGRRGHRRRQRDPPQPGRAVRSQPADRVVHVPRPDGCRQDRAGPGAGPVPVRRPLVAAAEAQVAADPGEPASDALGGGDGGPEVIEVGGVGLGEHHGTRRRALHLALLDRSRHRLDLSFGLDHRFVLLVRLPRATSVARASSRGCQCCLTVATHASTSSSAVGSIA